MDSGAAEDPLGERADAARAVGELAADEGRLLRLLSVAQRHRCALARTTLHVECNEVREARQIRAQDGTPAAGWNIGEAGGSVQLHEGHGLHLVVTAQVTA